eukprot:SAG11_NODE_281_length_11257_cov_45.949633_6_plen_95_part_00
MAAAATPPVEGADSLELWLQHIGDAFHKPGSILRAETFYDAFHEAGYNEISEVSCCSASIVRGCRNLSLSCRARGGVCRSWSTGSTNRTLRGLA